ncbi:hypothetical protein F4860DRAFT_489806 [Xylaria cubensis]|nr:hypothetical protein F4860DRAFT_489806 [Xylaria cubensis]
MDHRETTLEEDKAYAMLGIFSVQMTSLYGEGYATTYGRLRREVSQATRLPPLPVAEGAAFDSHAEEHNARCYPNTPVDLLRQIASWAIDPNGKAIFWLNGIAGTGKSPSPAPLRSTSTSAASLAEASFSREVRLSEGTLADCSPPSPPRSPQSCLE